MSELLFYCEVCFAVPLQQSFTYIYHPKSWVPPSLERKRKGKKAVKKSDKKEEEGSLAQEESPVDTSPGLVYPQPGQRVFASLGRSRKEGWIISASQKPPPSLQEAMAAGKVELSKLKELEIAEPKPLFGEQELRLARWLAQYYICSLGEALSCILPTGKKEKEPLLYSESSEGGKGNEADGGKDFPERPIRLSAEQIAAVAAVCSATLSGSPDLIGQAAEPSPFFYLFGPTGSGKTEVFLQCMAHVLKQGKSVIYLVPEISLCYQLQEELERRFREPVALLHSHLSAEMRLWYWRSLQEGRCRIVLGARSAVFAPSTELGLIIVDEEHEQSYKAGDTPRYHARQVAMRRCRDSKAILLMGSATPSLEAMHAGKGLEGQPDEVQGGKEPELSGKPTEEEAQEETQEEVQKQAEPENILPSGPIPDYLPDFIKKAWREARGSNLQESEPQKKEETAEREKPASNPDPGVLRKPPWSSVRMLRLTQRLAGGCFPEVEIIDLRRSKTMISEQLVREIDAVTGRGDQAILFLNRRGYSPIVECFSCGKVQECRHCSVALTYHKNANHLKCHHCGFSTPMISSCNYCHKNEMEFVGFGTEQIEEELQRYFGHLRIARLDTDVSRKKGRSQKILQDFRSGQLDLLVGTQMVAKGLNFERVKLVGVVLADTSLNMPDFRAAERSFSLLVQVAGRAGRFSKDGKVLIQTYRPESEVIAQAAALNWRSFYPAELELRRLTNYPPYSRLIRFVFRGGDAAKVKTEAMQWYSRLQQVVAGLATHGTDSSGEGSRELVPAPCLFVPCECPYFRVANKYRYHMLLRSSGRHFATLHRSVRDHFWQSKRNPSVYVEVDVDPSLMM
ncbi:primosomal protein N' [Candidatus Haliotispira prima]|uniref:Replication restart protein PriA n=1 Tax=Candidatus Haliotispira prima TaxID=3034016 RepID=A0ABY8MI61_9SPIO|nr:primosomal protein N' [Candidatus Haliotispira prima]